MYFCLMLPAERKDILTADSKTEKLFSVMLKCRLTLEENEFEVSFGANKKILSLSLSMCQSYFLVQLLSAEE